ncbi:MAG: hypothetical protein HY901_29765, partial [Deltaproteobacteria bacterium]|nr:hypothetical protein [Deltaproteobacteria bacterium]
MLISDTAAIATGGARAEALEAVLVKVDAVTVTDANPPADPADTSTTTPPYEFTVGTAGTSTPVRVHDFLFHMPAKPQAGEIFESITGVLHWDYNNSKIEPRDANDLAAAPAGLVAIEPASGTSIYVGSTASPTFPTPVAVRLSRAASADTVVNISTSAPGDLAAVGGQVTVPVGQVTANVLFNAPGSANGAVTVTASLGGASFQSTVAVVAVQPPTSLSLTPEAATAAPGETVELTVAIDKPAGPAGFPVALSSANGGSVPTSVTIAANTTNAHFVFTAGAGEADVVVTASNGSLSDTATMTVRIPQPTTLTLAPAHGSVLPGGVLPMTVSTDVNAPADLV